MSNMQNHAQNIYRLELVYIRIQRCTLEFNGVINCNFLLIYRIAHNEDVLYHLYCSVYAFVCIFCKWMCICAIRRRACLCLCCTRAHIVNNDLRMCIWSVRTLWTIWNIPFYFVVSVLFIIWMECTLLKMIDVSIRKFVGRSGLFLIRSYYQKL